MNKINEKNKQCVTKRYSEENADGVDFNVRGLL